ncbi:MAG: phosphodiester glycosidase family protein [Hyphomicrobium sp.]|nr:phosphodiester glycosidase family protein [Hyphomicrobium sp.]
MVGILKAHVHSLSRRALHLGAIAVAAICVLTGAALAGCRAQSIENADYVICEFAATDGIELFLRDAQGTTLGQFGRVREALQQRHRKLVFAMNAGMYHEDRSPVGLYIENGRQLKKLSTSDGPGNFSMKPNGVFFVDGKKAGVLETKAFLKRKLKPKFATQSGPMLVIDGKLHPRFLADATSKNRRNGVGVAGAKVIFALAETPVTLHQFARAFRDTLKTPNALYLDGSISRLYAADIGRNDIGFAMGPIVAVSVPLPDQAQGAKP